MKPARRFSDLERALILMTDAVADGPLISSRFGRADACFADLLPTTWPELLSDRYIQDRREKPGPLYRLTPSGWARGLDLSGALQTWPTRDRLIALRTMLKGVTNRYQDFPQPIDVRTLAQDLRLPVGWLHNAMRAELLQMAFPDDLMNAELDTGNGVLIHIPPTFGMKRRVQPL